MAITINPYATNGVTNGFNLNQTGYVQGFAFDDSYERQMFEGGQGAASLTTPVWGGVPLTLTLPATTNGANPTGPQITLATAYANIGGWAISNQASAGVISASSNVPLYGAGMSINYVRFNPTVGGSNIRLVVKCDPTLLAALAGGSELTQVSWDFTNQQLIAFATTALPIKGIVALDTNSKTVSYNAGTGNATYTDPGNVALIML